MVADAPALTLSAPPETELDSSTPPLLPDVLDQMRCFKCLATKPVAEFREGRHQCLDCERDIRLATDYPALTDGERACTRCGAVKPLTEFMRFKRNYNGRSSRCLLCQKDIQLRRRRGATIDWRAMRWALNGGNCGSCGKPVPLWGKDSHLDHIEVEGMKIPIDVLHHYCNQGIGILRHDPDLLRAGAAFCERTR